MPDFKQCEFHIVRYVPDVVKDEPVNIGIVLLESGEGDDAFTDVRFTRDWRRARCADPDLDVELMESFEGELRRALQSRAAEVINYMEPMSRRDWLLGQMQRSFSGAFQLTPAKAVLTESPAAELGILAQRYLETAARERRVTGRRMIYSAMRGAFEQAGAWNFMLKDIAVAQYTRTGDPLKIDCGYKSGDNVVHMFHAVSLATAVDSAKVVAFSYQDFRPGLEINEKASANLFAIVEDGLDRSDANINFAIATLDRYGIDIATVSQMPGVAERARLELRL